MTILFQIQKFVVLLHMQEEVIRLIIRTSVVAPSIAKRDRRSGRGTDKVFPMWRFASIALQKRMSSKRAKCRCEK